MSKCKTCGKYASFGYENTGKIACSVHKTDTMVQKKKKLTCIFEGCQNTQIFGYVNGKKLYCSKHKLDKMINLLHKLCKFQQCIHYATYGNLGGKKEYCKDHKQENMKNLNRKKCVINECTEYATYSLDGKKVMYCSKHKTKDMFPTKNLRCCYPKCNTVASFYKNDKKIKYCYAHSDFDMVSKNPKCKYCDTQPCFGKIGGTAKYCSTHKKDNMVDLHSNLCIVEKCGKHASFSPVKGKPLYCSEHSDETMTNTKSKKCYFKDCNIVASFGHNGIRESCKNHIKNGMTSCDKLCKFNGCTVHPSFGLSNNIPIYCLKHKHENMVDVVSKKCEMCNICCVFGMPDTQATRCFNHKEKGMINIKDNKCTESDCNITAAYGINFKEKCISHKTSDMSDLRTSCCSFPECKTRTRYGLPGNLPTHCAKHKLNGQIAFSKSKCITKPCQETAIYGINKALHCEDHKEANEYNLIEKECKSCKIFMILNDKQLCGFCDPTMMKTFQLAKQKEIKSLLDTKKIKYTIYDKIIDSGICGYERPDFLFDCDTHFVVLEVDENQHKRNDCDNVRMFNMSQSLGLKTIFIRYNPDDFKINNKKQIITKIKKHDILLKCLATMMKKKTDDIEFVSAIYLFYDDYDASNSDLEKIEIEIPKTKKITITKIKPVNKKTIKKIINKNIQLV